MQPLTELDKLIREFENEVQITKSVNGLSDTLLERSQQQAGQLADMQERLQTSIGAMNASVEQLKTFSDGVTRRVQQWQIDTEQQLSNGLGAITTEQQAAELEMKVFRTAVENTLASQFERIDERQRKFFVELADSLRVRLEDHRSELKLAISREASELKADVTNELIQVKAELSAEVRRQRNWLTGLSFIGGLTVILLGILLFRLR